MPIPKVGANLQRHKISVFNPTAMGSTGAIGQKVAFSVPFRGTLEEVGFVPNSLVASTSTITVDVNPFNASPTASAFAQAVSSTLGSFTSQQLFEGAVASVVPASNVYLSPGDVIRFTTSGNLSAIGAEVYAIIRRG